MKIFSQFSDIIDEIYKTDSFYIYIYITNFNSVHVEYSQLSLKVIEILFFDIIMYRTKSKIHKGNIEDKVFTETFKEVCINFNEFAKFIIKYTI